ncbi:MAG: phage minor tail protein L, partial [Minwuia sp.]|nr:phage minor tail protein L [Minwuia sp.]
MTALAEQIQNPSTPAIVTLWVLDATAIGGTVERFTHDVAEDGSPISFDGNTYLPRDVTATGFQRGGKGAQGRPTIRLHDPSLTVRAMLRSLNGLRGAEVTRIRTFRDHLDDGDDPDPEAVFPLEVYRISHRVRDGNRDVVAFELSNGLDQAGVMVPGAVGLRNFCDFVYRRAETIDGAFILDDHDPCPYTGTPMFDADGTAVTDRREDVCGKRLSDCRLRFGEAAPLPYRGLPGLRRF